MKSTRCVIHISCREQIVVRFEVGQDRLPVVEAPAIAEGSGGLPLRRWGLAVVEVVVVGL